MILKARNIFRFAYRTFWWRTKVERVPTILERLTSQMYYLIPFTICTYKFISWAESEKIKGPKIKKIEAPKNYIMENKSDFNNQQPDTVSLTTKIANIVTEDLKIAIPDPRIVMDPNYMLQISKGEAPKSSKVVDDQAQQQADYDLPQHHMEHDHAHQQTVKDFFQHHNHAHQQGVKDLRPHHDHAHQQAVNDLCQYHTVHGHANQQAVNDQSQYHTVHDHANQQAVNDLSQYHTVHDPANQQAVNDLSQYHTVHDPANQQAVNDQSQYHTVHDPANQQAVNDQSQYHTVHDHANQQAVNGRRRYHDHHHTEHDHHHTEHDHQQTKLDYYYIDPDYEMEHDHHIHL